MRLGDLFGDPFGSPGALWKIMVLLYKWVHLGQWREPWNAQWGQESDEGRTREGRKQPSIKTEGGGSKNKERSATKSLTDIEGDPLLG